MASLHFLTESLTGRPVAAALLVATVLALRAGAALTGAAAASEAGGACGTDDHSPATSNPGRGRRTGRWLTNLNEVRVVVLNVFRVIPRSATPAPCPLPASQSPDAATTYTSTDHYSPESIPKRMA